MAVRLVIKSAAQSVEDFVLSCEMDWTIAEVKNQISTLYPTKPKKEQQKLIYGGKLLPDDLTLKSILNQVQDSYVMHLVCPLPPVTESEKKKTNKESSVPPVCTVPPPLNPGDVYTQVNQPLLTPSSLPNGISGIVNSVAGYPGSDAAQQYLAMQQMYIQLMTQYFAQYNGSIPYGPVTAVTPPVQQQQTAGQRQDAPPNAAPRQPEEEEDYIDYVYAFVRIFFLTSLLLYYSSLTRLVSVTLLIVFVILFGRVYRRHQQLEMRRLHLARQSLDNTAARQRTNDSQTTENEVVEDTPNSESASSEAQARNPNYPSVPLIIFNIVTTFFSSLIPTDPLPVNVN